MDIIYFTHLAISLRKDKIYLTAVKSYATRMF